MSEASLEKKIIAAALSSRLAFIRIAAASDVDSGYTPYGSYVLKLIQKYYDRDEGAQTADRSLLVEHIKQDMPPKNQEIYINFLTECAALDVSAINVADVVMEAKRKHLGNQLAAALLDRSDKASQLMEEYQQLSDVEEEEEEADINDCSILDMVVESTDTAGRIRLSPPALDKACKSKTRRGHHLVFFARPETGKTALTLTNACGMALQGLRVGIFGNEEPVIDTRMRAACCLSGMTEEEIVADPDRAEALLLKRGWKNIIFVPLSPGTLREIDNAIVKYKLDVAIVDQIRNLNVGAETRVNQLEMAATGMRNIGKRRNCLMISVTQAGDSANNKLMLDMGDVDFSNTGIPATADLMVGMGVNKDYEANSMRMLALPKNKIGAQHTNFMVKINAPLSRLEDI